MTYIADAQLQARAAELWRAHGLQIGFDMEELLDRLGLCLLWDDLEEAEGQVTLGALRPSTAQVIVNEQHSALFEANPGLLRFTLAHEAGHWVLHCAAARSGTGSIFEADRTWCRDGSFDPIELQAEGFASYLLMPTDRLRPSLPLEPWTGWPTVYRLAEQFAVSPTAMIVRLQRGSWAYRGDDGTPKSGAAVSGAAEQPQMRLL